MPSARVLPSLSLRLEVSSEVDLPSPAGPLIRAVFPAESCARILYRSPESVLTQRLLRTRSALIPQLCFAGACGSRSIPAPILERIAGLFRRLFVHDEPVANPRLSPN